MAEILLDIKIPNIDTVRAQMKGMDDKAEIAISRAINRTIQYMSSYIAKEAVPKRYKVKTSAVKKTLESRKSSRRKLSGYIKSSSSIYSPLIGFDVSPAKVIKSNTDKPAFYKSRVVKGNKLAELTGNSNRSKAFVAQMPSGHVGVFQRILSGNEPGKITEIYGPHIPSMISSIKISKEIRNKGHEFLRDRLDHKIKYLLGGAK